MKLFRLALFLSISCLGYSTHLLANEIYDPESCGGFLEPQRQEFIKNVQILEESFVQFNWDSFKYSEVVYGPLWKARLQRNDSFSPEERAEGTVLFGRYQHEAEGYEEGYLEQQAIVKKQLLVMRNALLGFRGGCSAWGFQDCLERWHERIKEEVRNLDLLMQTYFMEKDKFHEKIKMSLMETISEHHEFKFRFQEQYFMKWQVDIYPKTVSLLRNIRTLLEVEWPGATCCLFCTADDIAYAESSLSKVLVADKLGSKGVNGNVVGRLNLGAAMDEYFERIDDRKMLEPAVKPVPEALTDNAAIVKETKISDRNLEIVEEEVEVEEEEDVPVGEEDSGEEENVPVGEEDSGEENVPVGEEDGGELEFPEDDE